MARRADMYALAMNVWRSVVDRERPLIIAASDPCVGPLALRHLADLGTSRMLSVVMHVCRCASPLLYFMLSRLRFWQNGLP